MLNVASYAAYEGIQRAAATAGSAARDLSWSFVAPSAASPANGVRTDKTVNAILRLNQASHAIKANVAVARTVDEMKGTLIDTLV